MGKHILPFKLNTGTETALRARNAVYGKGEIALPDGGAGARIGDGKTPYTELPALVTDTHQKLDSARYGDDVGTAGVALAADLQNQLAVQAPYLDKSIHLRLSENPADAVDNAAAINAVLEAVAGTGRTVRCAGQSVPLGAAIVLPAAGGFAWECSHGFELRPDHDDISGFVRQADFATTISDVKLCGLRIAPETDGGTGNSYIGNHFFLNLTDSELNDLQAVNYFGDQAFVMALYRCAVDRPHFYTEDVTGGSGGFRLVGGEDTIIRGATGQSGDDALQFVPIDNAASPGHNLPITRCGYIGGAVASNARVALALCDQNVTASIEDCFFQNIVGRLLPSAAAAPVGSVFTSYNATGVVRGLNARGLVIDETTRPNNAHACMLYGGVFDSDIELQVRNPSEALVSFRPDVIGSSGNVPTRNTIRVRADQAPAAQDAEAVHMSAGEDNTIEPRFVCAANTHGVLLAGGTNNTVRGGYIRDIPDGFAGVRDANASGTDLIGTRFTGAGAPYSFNTTTRLTARALDLRASGMTLTGGAPMVVRDVWTD